MDSAMGTVVRFYTRGMYNDILQRMSWKSYITVSESTKTELLFWKGNSSSLNEADMHYSKFNLSNLNIFSDASNVGYGAYIEEQGSQVTGTWFDDEASKSSTWREIEAINRSIDFLGIEDQNILWHTDV